MRRRPELQLGFLYFLGSLVGFGRDLVLVRAVGLGGDSDAIFNYSLATTLFVSLAIQTVYLPLAFRSRTTSHRALGTATLIAMLLSPMIWSGPLLGHQRYAVEFSVWLIASLMATALVASRWRDAYAAGRTLAIGSSQLFGSAIPLLVGLVEANIRVLVPAVLLSWPIGTLVGTIRVPRMRSEPRYRGADSSLHLMPSLFMPLSGPLLAIGSSSLGPGVYTAFSLAGKIANVPIGLLSHALGTTAFIEGVSDHVGKPRRYMFGERPMRLRVRVGALVVWTSVSWGLCVAVSSTIGAVGDFRELDLEFALILFPSLLMAPVAVSAAAMRDHLLADQRFRLVGRSNVAFLVFFGGVVAIGVIVASPYVVALAPACAFAAQQRILRQPFPGSSRECAPDPDLTHRS
jgi:hypothetical protein